jgi:hypothetical protein
LQHIQAPDHTPEWAARKLHTNQPSIIPGLLNLLSDNHEFHKADALFALSWFILDDTIERECLDHDLLPCVVDLLDSHVPALRAKKRPSDAAENVRVYALVILLRLLRPRGSPTAGQAQPASTAPAASILVRILPIAETLTRALCALISGARSGQSLILTLSLIALLVDLPLETTDVAIAVGEPPTRSAAVPSPPPVTVAATVRATLLTERALALLAPLRATAAAGSANSGDRDATVATLAAHIVAALVAAHRNI